MPNANNTSELRVLIRDMTVTDLDRVTDLEKETFPDPWSVQSFREILSEAGWHSFVAEAEGEVIAYACLLVVALEGHLTNIAVSAPYRRKAVARQLLDRILRTVKRQGCDYILLEVRPGNVEAIAFYEKHGFQLLYRRPHYYKNPVEDALVMVRYLDREDEGD